jgi:hypothetical protein
VATPVRGFVWLPFALAWPWFFVPDIARLKVVYGAAALALLAISFGAFSDKVALQEGEMAAAESIAVRARVEGTPQVFIVSARPLRGEFPQEDLTAKLGYLLQVPVTRCALKPQDCDVLQSDTRRGIFKSVLNGIDTLVVRY